MTALYAGSFDPVTCGHIDIITRAASLFSTLYVVVGVNPDKKPAFSQDERVSMLADSLAGLDNVRICSWSGLTADFAREHGVRVLVRGIRDSSDLDYELSMADYNRSRLSGCEVLFLPADARFRSLSSGYVRKIALEGGSLSGLVPPCVEAALAAREPHPQRA